MVNHISTDLGILNRASLIGKGSSDVDAARAMFQRIAEYPRERLEEIVNRLPASLVSEDKKQAWINGLMESKEPTKKVIEKSLTKQVLELPSETGIGSIGKKSASNLML